jgi:hypothetical protein
LKREKVSYPKSNKIYSKKSATIILPINEEDMPMV